LLIFLRVAYVCVMSPFAPQAFTWTNIGFIGLCLLMQFFASLLPNRNAANSVSADRGHTPVTAARSASSHSFQ
jgi:hypothetical protein